MKAPKDLSELLDELKREVKKYDDMQRLLSRLYPDDPEFKRPYGPLFTWNLCGGSDRASIEKTFRENSRALLVQRVGGPAGRFVLYKRYAGKIGAALVEPSPKQRRFLSEFMRGMIQHMNKRNARSLAARKKRENAGPRESIRDIWNLFKAGKQPD